jgi:hypothetical protein
MTNRVLLNNVDHHDLRVITRYAAVYGDAINQALIFPTEFEEAQREYPILFRKDAEGAFVAVVLLGLDADENLFLDDDGWSAQYVPAIQQRGPFSIGVPRPDAPETAEPMVHIDLDDPRVSRTDGQAVFRAHGGFQGGQSIGRGGSHVGADLRAQVSDQVVELRACRTHHCRGGLSYGHRGLRQPRCERFSPSF